MRLESTLLDSAGIEALKKFKKVGQYIKSIGSYEMKRYEHFQLIWLKQEEETVGYVLLGKVQGSYFEGDEDGEEIMEVMEKGKDYTYIPYFEVFDDYQGKGLGTSFWKLVEEMLEKETVIIYSTDESYNFWTNNGFDSANYSDWWLQKTAS
jgi:GNAT superfamily N-acetyltransferase